MITDQLKRVLLRELNLEDFSFEAATTANQVPGWDSLSHVRVITAVETEFGVRFRPLEIVRLRTVGDLQEAVNRKLAK